MRYNLRQVQCFISLAESLHFGKAASKVNMTQPAFSRQIMGMEEALQIKLVNRDSHNVSLTDAGIIFLEGCEKAIKILEKYHYDASLKHKGLSGALRIGHTSMAINSNLPSILNTFNLKNPEISIEPFQGFTDEIIKKLRDDELDLGMVTGPLLAKDLYFKPVFENSLLVALWSGHPLVNKSNLKIQDLANERFIFGSEKHWRAFLSHINMVFEKLKTKPQIAQGGFKSEGVLSAVAEKMGITICADCAQNYRPKNLVFKKVTDLTHTVPTIAIWRKGVISNSVNLFLECLVSSPNSLNKTPTKTAC